MGRADRLLESRDLDFVQYVYSKIGNGLGEFGDLSKVEDLFDSSYLQDATLEEIAIEMSEDPKVKRMTDSQKLRTAEDKANRAAKWCIDNMDFHLNLKSKLFGLARNWARLSAPIIVHILGDNKYVWRGRNPGRRIGLD